MKSLLALKSQKKSVSHEHTLCTFKNSHQNQDLDIPLIVKRKFPSQYLHRNIKTKLNYSTDTYKKHLQTKKKIVDISVMIFLTCSLSSSPTC